jgi:hypothetical protein
MPTLADLRRRINVPQSKATEFDSGEELLVADTRSRVHSTQIVEHKLNSMLRRSEERLQRSLG